MAVESELLRRSARCRRPGLSPVGDELLDLLVGGADVLALHQPLDLADGDLRVDAVAFAVEVKDLG